MKDYNVFHQRTLAAVQAVNKSLSLRDALILLSQNEGYLISSFEKLNAKYNNDMTPYHMAQLVDEDILSYVFSKDDDYSSILYKMWLYAKRQYRRHLCRDGLTGVDYLEVVDLMPTTTAYAYLEEEEEDVLKPFVYCPKFRYTSIRPFQKACSMILKGLPLTERQMSRLGWRFEVVGKEDADYFVKKRIMKKIIHKRLKIKELG